MLGFRRGLNLHSYNQKPRQNTMGPASGGCERGSTGKEPRATPTRKSGRRRGLYTVMEKQPLIGATLADASGYKAVAAGGSTVTHDREAPVREAQCSRPVMTRRQRTLRAGLTVAGGFLVHLSLGTMYTFGNMTPYLTSYIRVRSSPKDLTYSDSIWVYAMTLMGQGGLMFVAGLFVNKIGPRWTTLLGSWAMSLGVALTYFTIKISFNWCLVTYGVLFGCGLGCAYGPPLAASMRWLPKNKGLVNGIVLAGFGGGAFVFDQVQTAYINPNNLAPDSTDDGLQYYSDKEILDRVPSCFLLLGGCYAVLQLIGSMLITFPPTEAEGEYKQLLKDEEETLVYAQEKNEVHTAKPSAANGKSNGVIHSIEELSSLNPLQMLKTRAFYTLWFMYLLNGQTVVFISSLYKAFGQEFISDDRFLALVGAFASMCNAGGRIMWGSIADRFSIRVTMICLSSIMAALLLTFQLTQYGKETMYFIWVCALFLTFSGNFALFPTATAKSFGQKYVVMNYGLILTSQAFTGVFGAVLAQQLLDTLHWFGMLCLMAGFSIIGGILAFSFNVKNSDGTQI